MNGVSNACISGVVARSLHKSVPLVLVLIDQIKAENVSNSQLKSKTPKLKTATCLLFTTRVINTAEVALLICVSFVLIHDNMIS
jgi:hypothetical protein